MKHLVDSVRPNESERVNAQGNTIVSWFLVDAQRYRYDAKLLRAGWQQWDTDQDAHYFGVWVHATKRETFTYCEGDCYQVFCVDAAHFRAELADMERVYGAAPPSMVVLDLEAKTRTDVYDQRLKPEDIHD